LSKKWIILFVFAVEKNVLGYWKVGGSWGADINWWRVGDTWSKITIDPQMTKSIWLCLPYTDFLHHIQRPQISSPYQATDMLVSSFTKGPEHQFSICGYNESTNDQINMIVSPSKFFSFIWSTMHLIFNIIIRLNKISNFFYISNTANTNKIIHFLDNRSFLLPNLVYFFLKTSGLY
jgi:hypothetical protein